MNKLVIFKSAVCILLMFAGWFGPLAQGATSSASKPNILLVLADDLGFSDLGCYGGEIPTPNLDRLATGGARFSSIYNSARCCPSRASLMTGLHPHQAGIGSFANPRPQEGWGPAYTGHLLPSCVTLAEVLGSAGYSTWMVGKWHLGIPGPIERGFQNYYGFRNFLAHSEDQWNSEKYARLPEGTQPELDYPEDQFYVTDVFNDYALEFIRQARAKQGQPWFLYLAHSSPHFPVQAPRSSIDKHLATYRQGWDVLRARRFERMKKLGLVPIDAKLPPRSIVPVDRDDIANGYPGQPNPAWDSLPADRREDLAYRMATFAAMVARVDAGVGRLVADLEQHGELDNTLILFLSDNGACYEWGPFGFDGESRRGITTLHTGENLLQIGQPGTHHSYGSAWADLGNTPLNLYKHFCHEGGISTPLIVHWPAGLQRQNVWVHDPAHLMDIVPTICEATGAAYPTTFKRQRITPMEGISLMSALRGRALPERPLAFEHQQARALRQGDWKVVWGKRMPTEPSWELFNVKQDRSEQQNLAAEKPELAKRLAEEWAHWAKRVGAEPFQPEATKPHAGDSSKNWPTLKTPDVKQSEFTITCRFRPESDQASGVLVAQGGREQGYALHLWQSRPAFDVRVNGKVTRIMAAKAVQGETTVIATLTQEKMALTVNGKPAAEAPSPGLLPVQPKDELSVGQDTFSAAGDYAAPNPFQGTISTVEVNSFAAKARSSSSIK